MARAKKVEDTPMNMVWVVSEHMPRWFGLKIDSEVLAVTSDYDVAQSIRAARKFSSDSKSFHTIDSHVVVEPPKPEPISLAKKTATGSGAVRFATTESGYLAAKKPRAKRTKA